MFARLAALGLCLVVARARACDVHGGWVVQTDVFTNLAANISVAGSAVSIAPIGSMGWTSAVGDWDGTTLININFVGGDSILNGTLSGDCNTIQWTNGKSWFRGDPTIDGVYLVFMTHLDIGFTNLAANVCSLYFEDHFPKAINVSRTLRAMGGEERFIYTEFTWLIAEYLDGGAGCTPDLRNASMIANMEQAIADGDVVWNAMPFSYFVELVDPALFTSALGIRDMLNSKYNKTYGSCGKSTDVTGMSRSAIPLFAASGVPALHIGYNGACLKPNMPPAFVWEHPETGTDLILFNENQYGFRVQVGTRVLAFQFNVDNTAPPTVQNVLDFWAVQRAAYPNAKLMAATLDDFAEYAISQKASLPRMNMEIGDSWLYGCPADPFKNSVFRETRRAVQDAIDGGHLSPSNPMLHDFNRRILKCPEHNWGLSIGQYFPDLRTYQDWDNADFHAAMNGSDYLFIESGWVENRAFLYPQADFQARGQGKSATKEQVQEWTAFVENLSERVALLSEPRAAHAHTLPAVGALPATFVCGNVTYGVNASGFITQLVDGTTGKTWADASNALGGLHYQTYTLDDFDVFSSEYTPGGPYGDFYKGGMDSANPQHLDVVPSATLVGVSQDQCQVTLAVTFPADIVSMYGAPAAAAVNFTVGSVATGASSTIALNVSVAWTNKTVTRLAEASWVVFDPLVTNSSLWTIDVLGNLISPLNVIENGTRHVHSSWGGALLNDTVSGEAVHILSLDVPVLSPGDIYHLLAYEGMVQPDMDGGVHWNLHNNLWGTAFPQWYGDDAFFRFALSLTSV